MTGLPRALWRMCLALAPALTPALPLALALLGAHAAAADDRRDTPVTQVTPGVALLFPRDYGAHPDFGVEWWYVTGWLTTERHEQLGFQITFFRTRVAVAHTHATNPSAFAATQLLIVHCAVSDPARGHLWQDQRIRRAGMQLAQAQSADTASGSMTGASSQTPLPIKRISWPRTSHCSCRCARSSRRCSMALLAIARKDRARSPPATTTASRSCRSAAASCARLAPIRSMGSPGWITNGPASIWTAQRMDGTDRFEYE